MKLFRLVIIPLLFVNAELFSVPFFSSFFLKESVASLDESIQRNGWTLSQLRKHILHIRHTQEYLPLNYNPHYCLDIHTRWFGSKSLIGSLQKRLSNYNNSLSSEKLSDLLIFIFQYEHTQAPLLEAIAEKVHTKPMSPLLTLSSIIKLACLSIVGYYTFKLGSPLFSYFFSSKNNSSDSSENQNNQESPSIVMPQTPPTPAPSGKVHVVNKIQPEHCAIKPPAFVRSLVSDHYPNKLQFFVNDILITDFTSADGNSISLTSDTILKNSAIQDSQNFRIRIEVEVNTTGWGIPWPFSLMAPNLVKTTRIVEYKPQSGINVIISNQPIATDKKFLPELGKTITWCSDKDNQMPPTGLIVQGADLIKDTCIVTHVE